jgi:hypothetical protein
MKQERLPILDALRCVQVKECSRDPSKYVRAHNTKVNSIRKIEIEPFNKSSKDKNMPMQNLGLISTSDDKHVKVWSVTGQLLGDINLVHEKVKLDKWDFKFDWAKAKRNQLRKVRKMVKKM